MLQYCIRIPLEPFLCLQLPVQAVVAHGYTHFYSLALPLYDPQDFVMLDFQFFRFQKVASVLINIIVLCIESG